MARVTFRLLGGLEVLNDGGVVPVGAAKSRALLTILLLNPNRVVPTDVLIDQLWGGAAPPSAPSTLHGYVSGLRKVLRAAGAGDLLQRRSPGYVVELLPGQRDIDEFDRLTALGRQAAAAGDWATGSHHLAEALALWRDDALAEFAHEEWAQATAAALQESRLVALDGWITAELALGRHAEIVGVIEQAVAATPLREQLTRHLMVALYRSGRQAEALRAFQVLRTALVDQLGIDPTPELVALEAAVLAQDAALDWMVPEATGTAPLPKLHARATTNLRPPLTTFVGRTDELTELMGLIRHNRLVTITGPGGAGKTRLASEAATRLVDGFSSGAWMVELAAVTDPRAVPEAIAAALQLAQRDTASTTEFLRGRMILLIIDNCEHLIDAVAACIDEMLATNPLLFVIATSRETLAVPGERVYAVPPLADAEAIELFTARARSVLGDVAFGRAASAAIRTICHQLDGMPLAVELAAARCRAFSPQQLAERLDHRFTLLTGGSRTALPRHQTLRNVVEWSYQLLADDERTLFERLSVMAGDYTVDAVEAICSDERHPAPTIAGALARLVDKSVVQVRTDHRGTNRYTMLVTLAQFAGEQLDGAERRRLEERHADHYGAMAATGVLATRGDDQRAWIQRVADEQENIRAALAGSLRAGASARAAGMVAGLGWYWWAVGAVHEGWRWAQQAVNLPAAGPGSVRGTLATWASFLGSCCEAHEQVTSIIAEADDLVRASFDDDPLGTVFCRGLLARTQLLRGDLPTLRAWLADVGELLDALPEEPWYRASRLYMVGLLGFVNGEGPAVFPILDEGAHLLESIGDLANATICFADLALVAETNNDFDLMRRSLEHARRIAGSLDITPLELAIAARVACAAVLQGHDDEAESLLQDVILWARDLGHRPALAFALTGLARLRFRQGRLGEAAGAAREALTLPHFEQVRVRAAMTDIIAAAESAAADHGLSAI